MSGTIRDMARTGLNRAAESVGPHVDVNTIGTRCSIGVFRPLAATPIASCPAHKIWFGRPIAVEEGGRLQTDTAVALPAGVEHRTLGLDSMVAGAAYFDARRFRFADVERLLPRFRAFVPGRDDPLELYADAFKVPAPRLDARLDKAVTLLELGCNVPEIARRVRLSESRLSHLFAERFGTPLRSWRSWLLLRGSMLEVFSGNNVTHAAHAAGFADAAHLSRTHRNAFGVPPSFLAGFRTRILTERLSVLDCAALRSGQRSPRLVADTIRSAFGR